MMFRRFRNAIRFMALPTPAWPMKCQPEQGKHKEADTSAQKRGQGEPGFGR